MSNNYNQIEENLGDHLRRNFYLDRRFNFDTGEFEEIYTTEVTDTEQANLANRCREHLDQRRYVDRINAFLKENNESTGLPLLSCLVSKSYSLLTRGDSRNVFDMEDGVKGDWFYISLCLILTGAASNIDYSKFLKKYPADADKVFDMIEELVRSVLLCLIVDMVENFTHESIRELADCMRKSADGLLLLCEQTLCTCIKVKRSAFYELEAGIKQQLDCVLLDMKFLAKIIDITIASYADKIAENGNKCQQNMMEVLKFLDFHLHADMEFLISQPGSTLSMCKEGCSMEIEYRVLHVWTLLDRDFAHNRSIINEYFPTSYLFYVCDAIRFLEVPRAIFPLGYVANSIVRGSIGSSIYFISRNIHRSTIGGEPFLEAVYLTANIFDVLEFKDLACDLVKKYQYREKNDHYMRQKLKIFLSSHKLEDALSICKNLEVDDLSESELEMFGKLISKNPQCITSSSSFGGALMRKLENIDPNQKFFHYFSCLGPIGVLEMLGKAGEPLANAEHAILERAGRAVEEKFLQNSKQMELEHSQEHLVLTNRSEGKNIPTSDDRVLNRKRPRLDVGQNFIGALPSQLWPDEPTLKRPKVVEKSLNIIIESKDVDEEVVEDEFHTARATTKQFDFKFEDIGNGTVTKDCDSIEDDQNSSNLHKNNISDENEDSMSVDDNVSHNNCTSQEDDDNASFDVQEEVNGCSSDSNNGAESNDSDANSIGFQQTRHGSEDHTKVAVVEVSRDEENDRKELVALAEEEAEGRKDDEKEFESHNGSADDGSSDDTKSYNSFDNEDCSTQSGINCGSEDQMLADSQKNFNDTSSIDSETFADEEQVTAKENLKRSRDQDLASNSGENALRSNSARNKLSHNNHPTNINTQKNEIESIAKSKILSDAESNDVLSQIAMGTSVSKSPLDQNRASLDELEMESGNECLHKDNHSSLSKSLESEVSMKSPKTKENAEGIADTADSKEGGNKLQTNPKVPTMNSETLTKNICKNLEPSDQSFAAKDVESSIDGIVVGSEKLHGTDSKRSAEMLPTENFIVKEEIEVPHKQVCNRSNITIDFGNYQSDDHSISTEGSRGTVNSGMSTRSRTRSMPRKNDFSNKLDDVEEEKEFDSPSKAPGDVAGIMVKERVCENENNPNQYISNKGDEGNGELDCNEAENVGGRKSRLENKSRISLNKMSGKSFNLEGDGEEEENKNDSQSDDHSISTIGSRDTVNSGMSTRSRTRSMARKNDFLNGLDDVEEEKEFESPSKAPGHVMVKERVCENENNSNQNSSNQGDEVSGELDCNEVENGVLQKSRHENKSRISSNKMSGKGFNRGESIEKEDDKKKQTSQKKGKRNSNSDLRVGPCEDDHSVSSSSFHSRMSTRSRSRLLKQTGGLNNGLKSVNEGEEFNDEKVQISIEDGDTKSSKVVKIESRIKEHSPYEGSAMKIDRKCKEREDKGETEHSNNVGREHNEVELEIFNGAHSKASTHSPDKKDGIGRKDNKVEPTLLKKGKNSKEKFVANMGDMYEDDHSISSRSSMASRSSKTSGCSGMSTRSRTRSKAHTGGLANTLQALKEDEEFRDDSVHVAVKVDPVDQDVASKGTSLESVSRSKSSNFSTPLRRSARIRTSSASSVGNLSSAKRSKKSVSSTKTPTVTRRSKRLAAKK